MRHRWLQRIRTNGKFFFDLIGTDRIRKNALLAIPFWTASLATGLAAVAYTKLFAYSEGLLRNSLHWHQWTIFLITPLCFLGAWAMVHLFAPNAKGSGIPQVMAAIELCVAKHEKKISKLLSLRIATVKVASSLIMILGGGAIGREGPTIQISGSIFRFVNKLLPKEWPKLADQGFILTGAAAGLAAAFNTPLGGVVFAVEELAKIHIRFFRTALFSAVIIAGLTAQAFLGPYLYLGYPDVQNLQLFVFLGVGATAIVSGLFGSITGEAILKVMKWKKSFNVSKTILFVVLSGVLIAVAAYFLNDEVLGSGKDLMNATLFTDNKYSSWHTPLMRIGGPILCFNTGAAGGIFAPALAAGASIGSYIAGLFHLLGSNANILILGGMVGFLTGITRTPFTSAILVLEMTDRHNIIFHLMIAALLSNFAALVVSEHSFYEKLKKLYLKDTFESDSTFQ